jgi:hypothetical protein
MHAASASLTPRPQLLGLFDATLPAFDVRRVVWFEEPRAGSCAESSESMAALVLSVRSECCASIALTQRANTH